MRVKTISATNFMSFAALDYNFPESGLFFVGGEVNGSPNVSNGAGKSAIFEALSWGLYGKTVREVKKLVRRGSSGAGVIIIFSDDHDHECEVVRTRDVKNMPLLTLTVDGDDMTQGSAAATQEMLDKYIGMSWLLFSTAVIFGEKAQRFIEASEADKKKVFDEILMLQQYLEAQRAVKDEIKSIEADISQHTNQRASQSSAALALFNALHDSINPQLLRLAAEREQAVAGIQKAKQDMAGLEIKQADLNVERMELERERAELVEQSSSIFATMREVETKRNAAMTAVERELAVKRTEARIADEAIRVCNTSKNDAERLATGAVCPTCGQNVTEQCKDDLVKHWVELGQHSIKESAEFKKKINILAQKLVQVREQFDGDAKEIMTLKNHTDMADRRVADRLAKLQAESRNTGTLIANLRAQISGVEESFAKRERGLKETQATMQKDIKEYNRLCEASDKAIAGLNDKVLYLRFWEEGFSNRGVKSFLIDEVLPHLNGRANYYLSALMDAKSTIIFDTESMTAKGEARDKFSIKLNIDGEEVEYASLSAGEKRRVDVSILMALQSLIFERSSVNINISALDEVFDSLDRTGIERVVGLLTEEAEEKAIYVISHLSEFKDYFQNEIIARKVDGISTIEEMT